MANLSINGTVSANKGEFPNIEQNLGIKSNIMPYSASITGNSTFNGYALVTTQNMNAEGTSKLMIIDVYINANMTQLVNQGTNQTCSVDITGFSTSEYTNINTFLECSISQATMAVTNDYMNSHACEPVGITRSSTGITIQVSIRRAYSEQNVGGFIHIKCALTK